MKQYVAIVGTIGSGKTTAARILAEHGYQHRRLSQVIYDEADRRGMDRTNRVILQDLGDELRKEQGNAVLAIETIKAINPDGEDSFVFESIRNHNEVHTLKQEFPGMLVIAVDAPVEIRYQRVIQRQEQYDEEGMSFEEFKLHNDRDLGVGNHDNEQNVIKCMDLADEVIQNTDGVDSLKQRLFGMVGIS